MTRFAVPLTVVLALSLAALSVFEENGPRGRLLEAARVSKQLREEARALPEDLAKVYVMTGYDTAPATRHAMLDDIEVYRHVRPWEVSYALGKGGELTRARPRGADLKRQTRAASNTPSTNAAPSAPLSRAFLAERLASGNGSSAKPLDPAPADLEIPRTTWPTLGDADGLRELLTDPDGIVRSLAAEALATLHQPEDVSRLAALLGDHAPGAVTLGWSQQLNAIAIWPGQPAPRFWTPEDPVPNRTWEERTVAASAQAGLTLMTGERFGSRGSAGAEFRTWWKNNDLGEDAVWFWQQRLHREHDEVDAAARRTSVTGWDPARRVQAFEAAWGTRWTAIVGDLEHRSASVQAKIYLATEPRSWGGNWTDAINVFFAKRFSMDFTADVILDLLDRSPDWRDVAADSNLRLRVLRRLSRLVEEEKIGVRDPLAVRQKLRGAR